MPYDLGAAAGAAAFAAGLEMSDASRPRVRMNFMEGWE